MLNRSNAPLWILLGGFLLYLGLLPRYDIGAYNDDAVYVIAGKSLLSGHYDAIEIPNQPVTTFPSPGLPMLLAPFIHLIQPHWSLLEYLSVGVTMVSVVLFWFLLRIWFSAGPSILLLALFAFNPTTAHFSGILMSEPYYLCFTLATFVWLNKLLKEGGRAWVFGVWLGWTSLMRPEGAVLIPSVFIALAYTGRWKTLRDSMIPAIAIVAFFQIRNWNLSHSVSAEYAKDLTACLLHWSSHQGAFINHAGQLFGELICQNFFASPWATPSVDISVKTLGGGIGLALAAAGIFRGARSAFSSSRGLLLAMVSFCYLYFIVHAFWSPIEPRYLLPLLPFVLILLALGFQNLAMNRVIRFGSLAVAGSVLLVTYSYQNGYAIYQSILNTPAENLTPSFTYSWLRGRTARSDVFLSPVAPSIFLYTQRQAISLIVASDEEAFRYQLLQNHIRVILDRPINAIAVSFSKQQTIDPNVEWSRIRRWLQLYPETFPLAYHNPSERTSVYTLRENPEFVAAYEDYLEALDDFKQENWDAGLNRLEESIRIQPGLACALNAYGATKLLGKGDLSLTEHRLLRAVEIRPQYPMALLNLARLYKREGKAQLSRKYVQRSIDASRALNEYENFSALLKSSESNGEIDLGDPPVVE